MALLNGIYIFVIDESVDYELDVTSHPVEKGINISDHARRQPYVIKLRGEIVGKDAAKKRAQVEALLNQAALITYQGRNVKSNGVILNLSTGHPNTIHGGCSFDMTIREIRVANGSGFIGNTTPTTAKTTPLKDTQETGTQKIEQNSTSDEVYTTRNGDSAYELVSKSNTDYGTIINNNPGINVLDLEKNTTITINKKSLTGNNLRSSYWKDILQ